MEESIRLGRVKGIPIGLNWSLLVVFALVAVGLGAGRFPMAYPDYGTVAYTAAGLVTAVLFFASILAHELGHALLAQRRGVPVEGITLWLFGGVARFRQEALSARDDLHIAVIGPVVSLAVAGLSIVLAGALDVVGTPGLVVGMFWWLAVINTLLAVFNLIPAAPLDGGRVLRALLWRRHGDRVRAATTAAAAGRIFGFVLVGLGLVELAFGAGLGGIWLMLLGWFIITVARAEETQTKVQGALSGMTVREVMTPDPVVAPDWLTLQEFLDQYVFRHRCSTFPLRGFDGELSGVVPLRALKRVASDQRGEVRVREIACPMDEVPTVTADTEVAELLTRLGTGGCTDGRCLVMEGDRLLGIVSPADLTRVMEYAELRGHTRQPDVA